MVVSDRGSVHTNPPTVVMLTADRQVDRRILLEADALEATGWTVTIVALRQDKSDPNEDQRIVRIGATKSAAIKETSILRAYAHARRILPMNGRIMRTLKELTWRVLSDQEKFFLKLFLPAALVYRPTVFLAHDLPMLPVAAAAAKATGARLAYDSHELYAEQEFSHRERNRWIEIERKYIGEADLVTTVNASIAGQLRERYSLLNAFEILNAVDLPPPAADTTLIHKRLGLAPPDRILLFQGGLSVHRNLHTIVDARAQISNDSIQLVFLGDGQLRESLAQRASRTGCSGFVHFLPAVSQNDLLSYSACADIGLIPYQSTSLNTHLCTPNKLFEFIAAGTPVLASDLPELRRFVTGYNIGAVADLSTPAAAAAAIADAFDDEKRLAGWNANLAAAQRQLNWAVEGTKFSALFDALR